ncbi:unnamed protein product, partial [Ilex paraguariensis]
MCEEVCRLALKRRYRLIPHIYTLFYLAHTMGTPVATPTFFADPEDPSLRGHETSFMLGPLLVHSRFSLSSFLEMTLWPFVQALEEDCVVEFESRKFSPSELELDQLQHTLPKGIWMSFDFDDSHPDLPVLYLQGGSIIPLGLPYQHVGEANLTDDLSLLVALDEHGKAEGVLFEDDGDGYDYTKGGYLLTTYAAELQSSVVTLRVSKVEGTWKRPKRRLHIQLLLGKGAVLDAWGTDGGVLQIMMPSENDVSNLVSASEKQHKIRL